MKKIIIFLFIMFCLPTFTEAAQINYGEKISGEYIARQYEGIKLGEQVTKIYSENHSLLYRINPIGAVNDFVISETSDYSLFSISNDLFEEINLLAYYGYGYEKNTADYWYSVAQFLIYKKNNLGVNVYYTDYLNGKEKAKYAIHFAPVLRLVKDHFKTPDFKGDYDLKINESLELVDNNNVLKFFKIKESKLVDAIIKDNRLLITPLSGGDGYLTLIKEGNKYNNKPTLYYNGDNQTFLLPGNYTPIEFTIKFKIIRGTIEITLKDDNNIVNPLLNNSSLKIDNQKYAVKNGRVGPINIYSDEVNVQQLSGNKMFVLSDEIKVKYNDLYEDKKITIQNRFIRTDLDIISDANVKLNIYQDDRLINSIITDNYGKGEINLPYGNYLIESPLDKHYYQVDENTPSTDLIMLKVTNPETSDNVFTFIIIILFLSIIIIIKCIKYKCR